MEAFSLDSESILVFAIVIGVVLGFLAVGIVIAGFLKWLQAWRHLSFRYRIRQPQGRTTYLARETTIKLPSGREIAIYNKGIHATLTPAGLQLKPRFLFWPSHRPVLLPWELSTKVREAKIAFKMYTVVQFETDKVTALVQLPPGALQNILDALVDASAEPIQSR